MFMVGDDLLVDKRTYPLWGVFDVLPAIAGELLVACPDFLLQRERVSQANTSSRGFSKTQPCAPYAGATLFGLC